MPVETALIDGEAVFIRPDGTTSYEDLLTAFGNPSMPISLYAFDLLHHNGEDLTARPLGLRKDRLKALLAGADPEHGLVYSDHFEGEGDTIFGQACTMGLEGIISKRADAPYRSGRNECWIKTKCTLRQSFVVGGFLPSGAGFIKALLVGYYEGERFVFAGKVGTGYTQPVSAVLRAKLDPLAIEKPAFEAVPKYKPVVWTRPELVGEIEFRGWEKGVLRHAAFKGLREDKEAQAVVLEMPR